MEENKAVSQQSIPASKVQRAAKFLKTGAKVGGNYIKHYALKAVDPNRSEENLHEDNANDIYDGLSELKGSALKVAQMMSMDKAMLPKAYSNQFSQAQYSAPPLSFPLVVRTFQKAFAKTPENIFDTFSTEAVHAASIGQVHKAAIDGKQYAVKVQYPGVAESVSSDLKLVKPFAVTILKLNEKDVNHYMEEVETMLLSETDYELELKRSEDITSACAHLPQLFFPKYYKDLSSKRILTMDWLEGQHLKPFLATNPSQEVRNTIGQALWDFYDFQIHTLRAVHADPHPGNFLLRPEGKVGIIDFGCVKVIPEPFYNTYFGLLDKETVENDETLLPLLYRMNFLYEDDNPEEKIVLMGVFKQMTQLLGRPLYNGYFDFGNEDYFDEVYEFGERTGQMKELKNSKRPRGERNALYINRTYFGLYSMLNELKAQINTTTLWKKD